MPTHTPAARTPASPLAPAAAAAPGPASGSRLEVRDNLRSLQSHILAEESKHPGASGDLSWILSAISLAGKTIANKVRRAGLEDVLGEHGDNSNVHGERQQKLDVIANEVLLRCLGNRPSVAVVGWSLVGTTYSALAPCRAACSTASGSTPSASPPSACTASPNRRASASMPG